MGQSARAWIELEQKLLTEQRNAPVRGRAPVITEPAAGKRPASDEVPEEYQDYEDGVSAADAASSEGGDYMPDDEAESAMRAEIRERESPGGEVFRPKKTKAVERVDPRSLPKLDDLVGRISPDVMEKLDELFRARFTEVRRVPEVVLKSFEEDAEGSGENA